VLHCEKTQRKRTTLRLLMSFGLCPYKTSKRSWYTARWGLRHVAPLITADKRAAPVKNGEIKCTRTTDYWIVNSYPRAGILRMLHDCPYTGSQSVRYCTRLQSSDMHAASFSAIALRASYVAVTIDRRRLWGFSRDACRETNSTARRESLRALPT